jgi:hypothetical protein
LQKIEIIKEISAIGRNRSCNCYLLCYGKDGFVQKVPASGEVTKAAFGEIGQAIHVSGIPVINLIGELLSGIVQLTNSAFSKIQHRQRVSHALAFCGHCIHLSSLRQTDHRHLIPWRNIQNLWRTLCYRRLHF